MATKKVKTHKTAPARDEWRDALRGWTADVENLLSQMHPRDEASNELFARLQQHGKAIRGEIADSR